jgi:carbon storage regulator CsrA
MLVLSRRAGERLVITFGDQVVEVCYLGQRGGQGRIGVIADRAVTVLRAELIEDDRPVAGPARGG